MPTTADPSDWWSLKPLQSPSIPLDRTNPIDAFIDEKLRESSLVRSPQANPRERLRRLYYDLIGLPPSPEDVQRFVDDPGESNYLRIVDELLESPVTESVGLVIGSIRFILQIRTVMSMMWGGMRHGRFAIT